MAKVLYVAQYVPGRYKKEFRGDITANLWQRHEVCDRLWKVPEQELNNNILTMPSNGIHSYYCHLMSYWVMKKSQLLSLELFKFPNT